MTRATSNYLMFLEKFINYGYQVPLRVFKIFHSLLGEMSFGMWISYLSEDLERLKFFTEWHEKILLAFTYSTNPVLLFNFGYDVIKNNQVILDWISKYRYLKNSWDLVVELRQKDMIVDDIITFIIRLSKLPPFGFIYAIIDILLSDYFKYYDEWVRKIDAIIQQKPNSIKEAIEEILRKFDEADPPLLDYLLKADLLYQINPLLHFQFATFEANVIILNTYKKIVEQLYSPKIPAGFYEKLHARLFVDNEKVNWKRLNEDGSVVFSISKDKYPDIQSRDLLIDVMGLKARRLLTLPVKIILYDSTQVDEAFNALNQNYTIVFTSGSSFSNQYVFDAINLIDYVNIVYRLNVEPYFPRDQPTMYNILYTKLNPFNKNLDDNIVLDPIVEDIFQSDSVPALWDYYVYDADKFPDVIHWAEHPTDKTSHWSYRKIKNSYVYEVPATGFWKNVETVENYMKWIGGTVWIFLGGYITDTPEWHQYPTLDQTLYALAEKNNIEIVDMRP